MKEVESVVGVEGRKPGIRAIRYERKEGRGEDVNRHGMVSGAAGSSTAAGAGAMDGAATMMKGGKAAARGAAAMSTGGCGLSGQGTAGPYQVQVNVDVTVMPESQGRGLQQGDRDDAEEEQRPVPPRGSGAAVEKDTPWMLPKYQAPLVRSRPDAYEQWGGSEGPRKT